MAARFPDIPQTVDPAETHFDYSFDHLIASDYGLGRLHHPHAIAIDSNSNRIYIAEASPHKIARVSIFSETAEFLITFLQPCMWKPYGIAIHRDNVYVTDIHEHSVFHFRVEFHLVSRVGCRGSDIGQFIEPRQLAVATNGDVFVSDRDNNRVQILDSELHYQRHISHHSMELPIDVKLTPDEVYILCQSSPCVKVFSYTGDLIRSLVTRGDIGMQVNSPMFFCLDADRNLLLSDWGDHQIKIFSKEGTFLHTVGGRGSSETGKFFQPRGIALTPSLKLVIASNNWAGSLQIFSSSRF